MEEEKVLTQKLLVAPTGADPGALDNADDGTAFFGEVTNLNGPAVIPVGGGFLFVGSDGALRYKGPNGTVTQLAGP